MKKILICSYSMGIGGIEKALITLLKNINYEKYSVDLILQYKEGVFLNEIPKDVNVVEYNASKYKFFILRKIDNLFRLFKFYIKNKNKYDSSISYTTYDNAGSKLARMVSKNNTLFIHSNYYEVYKRDTSKIKEFFGRVSWNKFNRLVFVSNEALAGFKNVFNLDNSNYLVINNLIDFDDINKKSLEKIKYKKSDINLLYVGRLSEEEKCITRILNLMKKLKENKVNAFLNIVGDGKDKKLYEKIIKDNKLDNVSLEGLKINPYPYFKDADYILLSSNYEGFPVIYSEALVVNKQVISTIDTSDDIFKASDKFFIVDKDDFIEEAYEIIKEKKKIKYTSLDFSKINEDRIDKILRF